MTQNSKVEGLVVRVDRKQCDVQLADAVVICSLRGRFFEVEGRETRPVTVGDRVQLERTGLDQGAIDMVLPRRNALYRRAAGEDHKIQAIAANLDSVLIVASLISPKVRPTAVDRLFVAADHAGIDAMLVLNKVDLSSSEEVDAFTSIYRLLGHSVLCTSAKAALGIDELRQAIHGKIVMLLGHSGVGKSSLVNALDPSLALKIGELTKHHQKGSHTTTFSRLIAIPTLEASIVDTPGLREFGFADLSEADLGAFFRDIASFHTQCKFSVCSHTHEPECAVKLAVERGDIRSDRFDSYLKILDELRGFGERAPRHSSF